MKKYILSIFAVVLAVGMVAFTAPKPVNSGTTYFMFVGEHESDYTNPAKWQASDLPFANCGENVTACTISSDTFADEVALTNYLIDTGAPNEGDGTTYKIMSKRSSLLPVR